MGAVCTDLVVFFVSVGWWVSGTCGVEGVGRQRAAWITRITEALIGDDRTYAVVRRRTWCHFCARLCARNLQRVVLDKEAINWYNPSRILDTSFNLSGTCPNKFGDPALLGRVTAEFRTRI